MLEVLDVHQPARPVVLEDQPVLAHHPASGGSFWWREGVTDHFEDVVVARHAEHDHHEALRPRHRLELLLGRSQMPEQVAVQLGLAVLVLPDGDVDLGEALSRHEAAKEAGQVVGTGDIDVEVRPGEAEHDRRLVLGEEDCVHEDSLVAVTQGDDQREPVRPGIQQPDYVGGLPPVEDRAHDLSLAHRGQGSRLAEPSIDPPRYLVGVGIQPGIRDCVGERVEDVPDQTGGRLPAVEGQIHRLSRRDGRAVEVRVDELDVLGDADSLEHAPGDGVVEGLGELPVLPVGDEA